jgi:hypothetical protein
MITARQHTYKFTSFIIIIFELDVMVFLNLLEFYKRDANL